MTKSKSTVCFNCFVIIRSNNYKASVILYTINLTTCMIISGNLSDWSIVKEISKTLKMLSSNFEYYTQEERIMIPSF